MKKSDCHMFCVICRKEFKYFPSEKKRKYCSRACFEIGWIPPSYWTGKKLPEEMKEKLRGSRGKRKQPMPQEVRNKIGKANKGKEPWLKGKIGVYSKETLDKMRGANSPAWRGGVTPFYHIIRECVEAKIWRTRVFELDNYNCQMCQKRGGIILNADHIKPFALIIKENNITNFKEAISCSELWDISNGRTICINCHKQTTTFGNGTKVLIKNLKGAPWNKTIVK